jgi:RNA polymerase sigma-B factor
MAQEEAIRRVTDAEDLDGEQDEAFVEFRASRDPRLRSALIEQNLPLATHLARRFSHRGEPIEDLEQVAAMALCKAVDRFEPEREVSFGAYATRTIIGELKRHFRDKGWAVRPPRRIQELCLELNREIGALTQRLGRAPTIKDLAQATEVPEADVIEALDASDSYWAASLDAPTADGEPLGSHLGSIDAALDAAEQRATLLPHLDALAPRERRIVLLRFVDGLTQSEIAQQVGLSQMQVSRLLRTSLTALRASYGNQTLDDVIDISK